MKKIKPIASVQTKAMKNCIKATKDCINAIEELGKVGLMAAKAGKKLKAKWIDEAK